MFVRVIKMLQYEQIYILEGIDINKTSASRLLCLYWYFKERGFKFGQYVGNECHDVLMTADELKNIAILNLKGVHSRCISWGISKKEPVNILNTSVLEDKGAL